MGILNTEYDNSHTFTNFAFLPFERAYAIAIPSVCLSVCLSACLSVCHTGGAVKNKGEVGKTSLILLGVPPLGVYNRNTVGENGDFLALCVNISETVR